MRIEIDLNEIEDAILSGEIEKFPSKLNSTIGDLLDPRVHYEQLIDFARSLKKMKTDFFNPKISDASNCFPTE